MMSSAIALGEGQPDVQDGRAVIQFLCTRLPSPASGAQAGYILERLAVLSRPFGTRIEIRGDTAEITVSDSGRCFAIRRTRESGRVCWQWIR